jgi:hypothetical protein
MACPINGRYVASSEYYEKNPEAARDVDPRAMVALARMNWLHSRYAIVRHVTAEAALSSAPLAPVW